MKKEKIHQQKAEDGMTEWLAAPGGPDSQCGLIAEGADLEVVDPTQSLGNTTQSNNTSASTLDVTRRT